jgi:hypothetical protein
MLLQLPPRTEALLTCNYEPRVVKGWVGHVGEGVNRLFRGGRGEAPTGGRYSACPWTESHHRSLSKLSNIR